MKHLFRVSFSIATSKQTIHLSVSIPTATYGPSSVFLTLSTGYACLPLASLFHPAATSEIFFKGFPRKPAAAAFTTAYPLVVYTHSLRSPLLKSVPVLCARLQGFDPISGPLPPTEVLRLPEPDPLLSFHTLGFFLNTLGLPSQPLRL
jgi:hypothetical protein